MDTFDLIIRGGTIATASDVFRAEMTSGTAIAHIGIWLSGASQVIDAGGKYVLPGEIDSHVHVAQPSGEGIVMADDFESGTLSALFGGNTTIMPFCLQQKGRPMREALSAYHSLAEGNCYTDVSFHLIISDPTDSLLGQRIAGARRRRLFILQGLHDLRGPAAERCGNLEDARRGARNRRYGHGSLRKRGRDPLPHCPP